MKRIGIGTAVIAGLLLGTVAPLNAAEGNLSGLPPDLAAMVALAGAGGSSTKPPVASTPSGGFGTGFGGMCGIGGCFGTGFGGMCGIGGCFGTGLGGMCGIGGCFGSHPGGCMGSLCGFSGFNPTPQQFYTPWTKLPERRFYNRDLQVVSGFIGFQNLTVIYYPERPSVFYFYDPIQKKYVGRYRRGAKETECFALIVPKDRRATLGEIPEKSYMKWSAMPSYSQLTAPPNVAPGPPAQPQLIRPPDALPGHDLPADELLDKEK
jgi:hypothetical protein